jgi:hypothetical protein
MMEKASPGNVPSRGRCKLELRALRQAQKRRVRANAGNQMENNLIKSEVGNHFRHVRIHALNEPVLCIYMKRGCLATLSFSALPMRECPNTKNR